jgi:hypothetical protein
MSIEGKRRASYPTLASALQYSALIICCGVVGALTTFALLRGISHEAAASILVAAGTFALAFYTAKSVTETKQIVEGDDLRFRQSRMPMVRLERTPTNAMDTKRNPGFQVILQNDGDGPARDVTVKLSASVTFEWDMHSEEVTEKMKQDGAVFIDSVETLRPGDAATVETDASWQTASSYISAKGIAATFVQYPNVQLPVGATNNRVDVKISGVRVKYTDIFGARFETHYSVEAGIEDPRSFKWVTPERLVPETTE